MTIYVDELKPYAQQAHPGAERYFEGADMSDILKRARWRQDEPRVYTLKAAGAVLATIKEAGWNFSVWSLADNSAGGWTKTTYAAMRAVRKALREAGVELT